MNTFIFVRRIGFLFTKVSSDTTPAGKPDVKVKEDANFYLSEDARDFAKTDLIALKDVLS